MKYLSSTITTLSVLVSGFALALPVFASAQAACTTTLSPGANIASAVSSAANGSTICLNSGNYGSVNLFDIARSGFVTLKSASGVSATISPNPGNSDYIRFESLTINGAIVDSCSTNIQFVNNTFTSGMVMRSDGCSPISSNNLVDGNTFNGLSPALADGRFTIKRQQNVTVQNNTFGGGGCSDGLQIYDSSSNITIKRNTFQNLQQGSCGVHVDAIQLVSGQSYITITENMFKNNGVSLGLYDGGNNLTVTNNVFDGTARNFQMGGFNTVLIAHNTAKNEGWEFSSDPGGPQNTNVVIENNILDNTDLADTQGNYCGTNCIQRNNLISRGSSYSRTCTNCVVGDAVYIGGGASSPSTWSGWQLAAGSPGKNAGNDALDMGTTYYGFGGGGGGDTTAPSTPANLSATAVSSSQINLSWTASTDNVGVTGYRIYRGGTLLTTVTGTSYSNTGLTASTAYSYYVRATDAAGNFSGNSNTANATTQAGTPTPTVTISANPTSVSSGGSSTLTWSSTNATSCTASGGWSGTKATSGSQALTNLTTTATYTLTCTGAGGSANASATVTVGAPAWINAPFASQAGTFTASFDATPSQNSADIVIGLSQSAASAYTGLAAAIRFYTNGNIEARNGGAYASAVTRPYTAGTNYHFRMVVSVPTHTYSVYVTPQGGSEVTLASNYAFRTEQSAVASLANVAHFGNPGSAPVLNFSIQGSDTTPPSAPINLSASAISSSQINLTWTASTDNVAVTGYRVFRGGTLLTTVTGIIYSNTGLTASTAYSYYVRAVDAAGNVSGNSNTASATTQAGTPPPTVAITATPQSIGSGDSSTLSWTSSGATSCIGTNFSTGGTTSGSAVVTPSASTLYSISCTGAGGTGTHSVTVTVDSLSALPAIDFPSGTFTWTTTNAVSCTASGGWTGSVGTSGSQAFTAPVSTTYILTCTGGGTTVQRSITITTSETATVSSKFQNGGSVTTTSALNVRSTPSTSGTLLGSQPAGVTGTVTGGPVQANGYWWWQIDFASGPDGWSVENWLN